MGTLILHAGAKSVNPADFPAAPPATRTHHPMDHSLFRSMILGALESRGVEIENERVAATPGFERIFGLLQLKRSSSPHWTPCIGYRSSYDKGLAASIVLGSRVFVCDNLAFTGEERISRKHTLNIQRDMPDMIQGAVDGLLGPGISDLEGFMASLGREIETPEVDHTLMEAVRRKVLPPSRLLRVLNLYETPPHHEYGSGTAWTLYNCVTHVLRGTNAETLFERTRTLQNILRN